MSWIKLDTRICSHPKLQAISFRSRWFYVCSLCYAATYHTDGLVSKSALPHIVPDAKRPLTAVKELVDAGLWDEVDDGWRIHDYADYQRSSGRIGEEDGGASRGRAGAGARTAAPARARSRAQARAQTRAPEEVEVEVEEEKPPRPPLGGRKRDRVKFEGELAEFSVTFFPGIHAGFVAHESSRLRARGVEPTVGALRPLLERYREPLL